MTRHKTLLIVLGALLLAGAWRSLLPLLQPGETAASVTMLPAGDAKRGGPHPGTRLGTLNLASLDRTSPGSATAGRDLWRFIDPPTRQPEPVPALPPPSGNPPTPDTNVTLNPPPQITVSLEYLGNFGPAAKKIAVLSNGQQIYNALEGDVIDGRFIVTRIGYESVDIRFVDFPDMPARRLGVR